MAQSVWRDEGYTDFGAEFAKECVEGVGVCY